MMNMMMTMITMINVRRYWNPMDTMMKMTTSLKEELRHTKREVSIIGVAPDEIPISTTNPTISLLHLPDAPVRTQRSAPLDDRRLRLETSQVMMSSTTRRL